MDGTTACGTSFAAEEQAKGFEMRSRKRRYRSPDDLRDWYVIAVIAAMTAMSIWVPVLRGIHF